MLERYISNMSCSLFINICRDTLRAIPYNIVTPDGRSIPQELPTNNVKQCVGRRPEVRKKSGMKTTNITIFRHFLSVDIF